MRKNTFPTLLSPHEGQWNSRKFVLDILQWLSPQYHNLFLFHFFGRHRLCLIEIYNQYNDLMTIFN